jgi:hypothetical protein
MEPTEQDIYSPEFDAVWQAIKGWDIRREPDDGGAFATGTDVMTILNALGLRGMQRRVPITINGDASKIVGYIRLNDVLSDQEIFNSKVVWAHQTDGKLLEVMLEPEVHDGS